jgi:hypothetical protein
MRFILLLCLMLIVGFSYGQSSKNKKKKRPTTLEQSASSLEPYTPYAERATTRKKSTKRKDSRGASFDSQQEFYARMAEVQKKREKTEKIMDKPQYSDPLYFGHKRQPKKRPRGKMKFCKECGIRH